MKIVFLGTPEFAVESLEAILAHGIEVAAVVTMPDKPAGRGHRMYQSPVKECALRHGLPVLQPVSLKDPAFINELQSIGADLFVVIAFRMLPREVWQMPPMGTFNLHASLLPRYRGAAPINRAVMNGDSETGVTTFFLKHEIDTGDIIARESVPIHESDNVGDVHDRLMHLGARLCVDTLKAIELGTLTTVPQSQLLGGGEPTPAPKIFKEDCRIDWQRPAREIHNQVRGLSPYPGAWSPLVSDGKEMGDVKIFETAVLPQGPAPLAPGQVLVQGQRLMAGTGQGGCIEILSLQVPGKRRISTAEWLRGARLAEPRFM